MENNITSKDFEEDVFDTAIIGAGVSGLICDNILAKNGYKNALIEKNDRVGGRCVNIERGNFVFDLAIHFISSAGKGGLIEKILSEFTD
jgi:phytoene dehydrogenase-like protein